MTERFLTYLQQERRRLDQELERALAHRSCHCEIARLDQLRQLVDEQVIRWSGDLTDRLAART